MRYGSLILGAILLTALLGGCHTVGGQPKGVLEIPESRDVRNQPKIPRWEAENAVDTAHRVGAQHYSPYNYFSARDYLKAVYEEKAEGGWVGVRDYTLLAKKWADAAIAEGSGIPDGGEFGMPATADECRAEFARLKARFQDLCPMKAKLVSPVIYAHIEVALSRAEHELAEPRHYPDAARALKTVEPDIDTLLSQDVDGDGIADMFDGDPWAPEDKDNYEDRDGIPEPKPYPVLDDVNFDTAKWKLSSDAKGYLRGIAHMLVDGYSEATLYVDGHTDERHTEPYNVDLSEKRAKAANGCLTAAGAKASQLRVAWHGELKPKGDNSTAAGRAVNRRVESKLDSPDVVTKYCKCAKCTAYK